MVAPLRQLRPAEMVRVHVAGKDPLVRSGLVGLLAQQPTLDVVGMGAPDVPPVANAQVVLRDAGPDGADHGPAGNAPHLVLVPHADGATRALRAGARGVLRRDVGAAHLVAAVRAVAAGLVVQDPDLAAAPAEPDPLSPREREVLQLLAEGLPNKLIADRLHISDHTAKFHVNAILDKLKVGGRTEAVVLAARRGWLHL